MWNYDKLFAEGNVVGIKYINYIGNHIIPQKTRWGIDNEDWKNFWNNELKSGVAEIQYIIRLDEHGNVVEKLFDRDTDMPKPMPELETGMFVRVAHKGCTLTNLGYIDKEKNVIIYQDGDFDYITGPFGINHWKFSKLVEVYDKHIQSFNECNLCSNPLWRSPEY